LELNVGTVFDKCEEGKMSILSFWNKMVPVKHSSRKLKSIIIASFAILALFIAGLHGQEVSRKTNGKAVNRERARTVIGIPATGSRMPKRIASRPMRALVDASKDGGIWWFPQSPETGFNPHNNHQGKVMADAMRARGWEVAELPRETVITPDKLQGFDIVIRPEPYFSYSTSEAIAYREAVAAGARLFLMSSSGGSDAVAAILGLRFGGRQHISLEKIIPHPLTAGIESLATPWVTVQEMPQDSRILAWGANEDPVLGYHSYSAGYVLFAGTSTGMFGDPLMGNALEFLERNSSYDLQRQSLAAPVVISAAGPPAPVLVSPETGEILPQPYAGEWIFQWDGVPDARMYQITVLGPQAALFLVNTATTSTSYVIPRGSGYICDVLGWRWSVRAQGRDGQWGKWSEERLFDVAPRQ
jgi:hypothetical protein